MHDLRLAIRQVRAHPGWALAIVGVLALGIGANTAMFSSFEAWVLRPLDFDDPERLVSLYEALPRHGRDRIAVSPENLGDWTARQRSFEALAAFRGVQINLNDEVEPARLEGTLISASLFPLLGKEPVIGRNFTDAEDVPGQPAAVALISDRLWRERFGADPGVVGRTIRLDGAPREIVGVMEPHFAFPNWADVWMPLGLDTDDGARDERWLGVVARLGDGVTVEAAEAELETIAASLAEEYPDANRGYTASVVPLREDFVPPVIEVALTASLVSGILVLLVICANVASLILARAAARSRETAVRAALGAGRWRLIRQNLLEALLLAVPAGLVGAYVGALGLRSMLSYVPVDPPYLFRMHFNEQAALYTLAMSLLAGAVCGLAPVFRASGARMFEGLRSGGREGGGKEATRFRSGLMIAELAMSTSLLIGAVLMVKSFIALQAVEHGFRTEDVVTAAISVQGIAGDDPAERVVVAERLATTLASRAGVDSVGMTSHLPTGPSFLIDGVASRDGAREPDEDPQATVHAVFADYFGAMGMSVEQGRDFTDLEKREGGDVVIVSAGLARTLWDDAGALGRRVRLGRDAGEPWLTVVGVVGDVDIGRDMVGFADVPRVQAYVPYGRAPSPEIHVVAHGGTPARLATVMRESFRAAAPGVPWSAILTMDEAIFRVRWVSAFFSRQLALYAVLATLIASIGIYGLTADSVARRTRELAIRTALGAERGSLVRLILRDAVMLGGIGVALGLGLALSAIGLAESMFSGVGARDPAIFASVAVLVLTVVVVAAALPANRASGLSPIEALRTE